MDAIELIRRGYRAIGFGAHPDVLALFDQLGREQPRWMVRDEADAGRVCTSREVIALDLFGGIPSNYEVVGAEPERWVLGATRARLTVIGHFRARPRGTWDVFRVPFMHTWWIRGGRIERVVSFFDGIEVARIRERHLSCP